MSALALAVMNHASASDATSSPGVPSSTCVMENSQRPASSETVQLADRSTIYRSHYYEELPTSRFICLSLVVGISWWNHGVISVQQY